MEVIFEFQHDNMIDFECFWIYKFMVSLDVENLVLTHLD
jgi:hypothetical protein